MKLYLAAPYAGRDIIAEHVDLVRDAGHEVTCRWVRGTRELGPDTFGASPASTDAEAEEHASMDLDDVESADVLLLYTANYLTQIAGWGHTEAAEKNLFSGGRSVEMGYALAQHLDVVVLGEPENIFQRGLCYHAPDIYHALDSVLPLVESLHPNRS